MALDRKTQDRIAALAKERDSLASDLRTAEDRATIVKALESRAANVRGACVRRREKILGLREATAVALASNWHLGENIEPEKVIGTNAFDLEIARLRAERFFHGVNWLVDNVSSAFKVRDMVLWLGGDIITGRIHDEQLETTDPVIYAVRFARSLIASGIKLILEKTQVEKLYVICSHGNHSRLTKKRHISTGAENSLEHMLYLFLMDDFKYDPRATFVVTTAEQAYFNIYDRWSRWLHGDEIRYDKGIGGVMVPVNRAVLRWNSVRNCALTCMGHHHTYQSGESVVINGSLVGYSPFALKMSYAYEPPRQAFFLLDSKRWKCMSTPIWVDSDDEPWKKQVGNCSEFGDL